MEQEKSSKGSAGRKVYTEEFRRSVVDHLISSGKSVAQVAEEFGINPWNLRDWKRRYGPTAKPADAALPQIHVEDLVTVLLAVAEFPPPSGQTATYLVEAEARSLADVSRMVHARLDVPCRRVVGSHLKIQQ